MIGPPGISLVSAAPPGMLAGPSLLSRMLASLDGIIEAKRGLGSGSRHAVGVINGHVLTALVQSATGAGRTARLSAGAIFTLSAPTVGSGTGYNVTASADAFLALLATAGDGTGYAVSLTHGNVVPAAAGDGSGTGNTATILTTDDVPLFADQLLLAGNAYYTNVEWPGHSHLLKDHRDDIGTLRDRRAGHYVQHTALSYGRVTCPLAAASADSFTIAVRVRPTFASEDERLYYSHSAVDLRRTVATDKFELIVGGTETVTSTSDVPINTWTHIIASWDADTGIGRIFINGALDTENAPATHPTMTYSLTEAGVACLWNGSVSQLGVAGMYDLRVWTRAVTTEHEATNIYNGRVTGDEAGLWPMQEEAGSQWSFDVTGNGRSVTWWTAPTRASRSDLRLSWPDSYGYQLAKRLTASGSGTAYDTDQTWISDSPVTGDFQVDFYLESASSSAVFGLQTSASATATNNFNNVKYGFQWLGSRDLGMRELTTNTVDVVPDVIVGSILSIRRSGSTVSAYQNGTLTYTYTATTGVDLYPVITFNPSSPPPVVLAYDNGEAVGSGHEGAEVTIADLLIPVVYGTSDDALGNPAGYIGEAPSPGVYKPPALIGDGSSVDVLCPNFSMTAAEGIDITFRYKRNSTGVLPTLRYLFDDALNRNVLALSGTTAGKFAANLNGSWYHFGDVPDDTDWHTVQFQKDGATGTAFCKLDGVQLGLSSSYTPQAIGGQVMLFTHSDNATSAHCDITVESVVISKYSDGTTYRHFVTDGVTTTMWDCSANAEHGTIGGTATYGLGGGTGQDVRPLYGGYSTTSGATPILVPPRLGTSLAADGNTKNVSSNQWGDPNAVVDRTAGITDSVFANLSSAPTAEALGDDVKTASSSKVRKRTTGAYVDRMGSAQVAMDTPGCDTYFGD